MTSITFGGGPSIEARRQFTNLKNGSEVPGYGGYIHQLKYNQGHTYGEETHLLSNKYPEMSRAKSSDQLKQNYSMPEELKPREKYTIRHQLPKAISGNKLTESMIPGYTGYIPSRKFQFSDTYKRECDQCIDNFITAKETKSTKTSSLIKDVKSFSTMRPVAPPNEVKSYMDHYRDLHPNQAYLQSDKREFTEPPMPGYTGYVPRIGQTELGLGTRFHETTKKGFESFKQDYLRNIKSSGHNSNTSMTSSSVPNMRDTLSGGSLKRIYVPPGMVPKYTGYVHGRKYQFGNTYGDTTRQLPICNHKYPNFGDYMTENPAKTVVC